MFDLNQLKKKFFVFIRFEKGKFAPVCSFQAAELMLENQVESFSTFCIYFVCLAVDIIRLFCYYQALIYWLPSFLTPRVLVHPHWLHAFTEKLWIHREPVDAESDSLTVSHTTDLKVEPAFRARLSYCVSRYLASIGLMWHRHSF